MNKGWLRYAIVVVVLAVLIVSLGGSAANTWGDPFQRISAAVAPNQTVVQLARLEPGENHNRLIITLNETYTEIVLDADFVEVVGTTVDGEKKYLTEFIRSKRGLNPMGQRGVITLPKQGENPIIRIELLPGWDDPTKQ